MDTDKKSFRYIVLGFLIILVFAGCSNDKNEKVLTGADLLISEKLDLVENKKLGIITNHTALLSNGTHLVDKLNSLDNIFITKLFGPEHGIRGEVPDGQVINDWVDSKTGIPVFSLYGKTKKLTKEMLINVDLLIFDIQDIGARFYTFISTMYYAIESAAENNIPIIILDRPNPINGVTVEGPVLDSQFKSFVGIAELPIRHGMTVGELAQFFNQLYVSETEQKADLTVIKMKNWAREFNYNNCRLKWIKPSPNIPTLETAMVYPGLCLLEGTNISEGRGTLKPFLQFGSPFINADSVIIELNLLGNYGCKLTSVKFIPVSIPNMSMYPKYKNQECSGIEISMIENSKFEPINFTINLIFVFNKLYPDEFKFNNSRIDKLWGSSSLREAILENKSPEEIINNYKSELESFKRTRKNYLLY